MRRILALGLVVVSAVAFGARRDEARPPKKPLLDAFLKSAARQPLVSAKDLSPVARAALERATITGTEERYGVPTFLWAAQKATTRSLRAMGLTPEQAARRALAEHAELYRGDARVWADATLRGVHDLRDGSAVVVSFGQKVKGLSVFRDEVKVVLSGELELVAIAGYLAPERKVLGEFRLAPETAAGAAVADLTGAPPSTPLLPMGLRHGDRYFRLGEEPTPLRTRALYYATPSGMIPAFYVEVELSVGTDAQYFSYVVSANDGALLSRKDLTAADAYAYRVWADATPEHIPLDSPGGNNSTPHPTATPSTWAPAYVPSTLLTLEHGPISTNDPWLAPQSTTTQGNNVRAYADLVKPNGFSVGDLNAEVTAPGTFDRTFDVNQQPVASDVQRKAAITQLFYNVNFFHDWYYDRGFDEAAGNAQASNLGRPGKDGDAINAEAQDYSGRNNANMSTPSDGASPRMQMYLFDGWADPTVTEDAPAQKTFSVAMADFGAQSYAVTAQVVTVDDGTAPAGDGCTTITTNLTGKIALVDRGTCTFILKAQNAEAAGAVGVLIADNTAASYPQGMSGTGASTIPTLSITKADGSALKTAIAAGPVTMTLSKPLIVDRDGALDNSIVAHEWGHYISNRLIGDGNGLASNMNAGMGEGWADFHSMLMVVKAEDALVPTNVDYSGTYGLAGYTTAGAEPKGWYFGIRRVPYSTDLTKDGLTFRHVADGTPLPSGVPTAWGLSGNSNSESHNTGEVWATMLWECYASLLRDPRYTFAQAQDRMLKYLVASYKATPLTPTFTEARDALLATAAATDLADYELFWRAFARRGMGMGAKSPARDSGNNSPVTESFDVGSAGQVVSITLNDSVTSCDHDGQLDNDEEGLLSVTVKNIGIGALFGAQVDVSTLTQGILFPSGSTAAVPTLTPFQTAKLDFHVKAEGIRGAQGATFGAVMSGTGLLGGNVSGQGAFRVNYDLTPAVTATDDVEAPASLWTSAHDATLGAPVDFRVYTDTATSHWWFGPDVPYPSDLWLSSPDLKVAANQDLIVTFKHRYDFETDSKGNYDGAVIEVSSDSGATWTDVGASAKPGYGGVLDGQGSNPLGGHGAFVGKSAGYPAFVPTTVTLGRRYAGQTVRLRFRIGTDDAVGLRGYEVDDIGFAGITNSPFPLVVADPNACGTNRAPVITVGPDQTVFEGATVTLVGSASDADGDPVTLAWTQRSGPAVTLGGPNLDTFTAPSVKADTQLVFELMASDGLHDVGPAQARVTVQSANKAPVASAPGTVEVGEGDTITISGTGTDPDGDPLTYRWTQLDGPGAIVADETTDTLSFTAPIVNEDAHVTLQLVVSDPSHEGAPALVDVLVKNKLGDTAPKGCGCTGGGPLELFGLVAVASLLRRRRS